MGALDLSLRRARILGLGAPAGSVFDSAWDRWRADDFSGSSPTITLNDRSGNGRHMLQQAGTLTPGTSANGQAQLTGNLSTYLHNAANLPAWPCTIVSFGNRAVGATCGLFGHQGAAPYSSLWYGTDTSNSFRIWGTNNTANADGMGGVDACWVARMGYGARVSLLNGIVQTDNLHSSAVRPTAAVSLGTQYRGLNLSWYETIVWNRLLTLDELDEVHAYGNSRYGMSIPLWSSYTGVPTFLPHGQSNIGRALRGVSDVNVPSEYQGSQAGVFVWGGSVSGGIASAFENLDISLNNHFLGDGGAGTYFGFPISLGKEYIDLHGGSVYIQTWGLGGSNLEYNGTSYWKLRDTTQAPNNTARCGMQASRNWWKALAAHQTASRRPDVKGIIWFQGENDATNQTHAEAYSQNLQDWIDDYRAEIGFVASKAPFVACRIHEAISIVVHPWRDTVRAGTASAIAAKSNCRMKSVDDKSLWDNAHLNPTGQIALGAEEAAAAA